MATRKHFRKNRKKTRNTKAKKQNKNTRKTKKWVTAFSAADKVLNKTRSLQKARQALKRKALENAEKIFGNVGRN